MFFPPLALAIARTQRVRSYWTPCDFPSFIVRTKYRIQRFLRFLTTVVLPSVAIIQRLPSSIFTKPRYSFHRTTRPSKLDRFMCNCLPRKPGRAELRLWQYCLHQSIYRVRKPLGLAQPTPLGHCTLPISTTTTTATTTCLVSAPAEYLGGLSVTHVN